MAAKLKHLVAIRIPGHFNVTAACGRRVDWLTGTADEIQQVTCDKCHAAAQKAALIELTATTAKEA